MKKIILLMFIICLILSGCSSTKMERGTYKKDVHMVLHAVMPENVC